MTNFVKICLRGTIYEFSEIFKDLYSSSKLLELYFLQGTHKISIKNIDLVVYDFDGVMTDNRVLVFQDGTEAVFANRSDGLGVEMISTMGLRQMILSTETNPVVQSRANKLNLKVIHGVKDKAIALRDYCFKHKIDLSRVLYVGNDLNDLGVMKIVGHTIAPADANLQIAVQAQIITQAKGGEGVIKEIAEHILS